MYPNALLAYCAICGQVGMHSEACITASAAKRMAQPIVVASNWRTLLAADPEAVEVIAAALKRHGLRVWKRGAGYLFDSEEAASVLAALTEGAER
jgi:hypothetical protein